MNEVYSEAIALRETGNYTDAISMLGSILSKDPLDALAWSLLAHVYIILGDLPMAESTLARARAIDPQLPQIAWNSARILLKQQKFSSALEVATSMHLLVPEDAEGLGLVGNCLRLNGKAEEGLAFLDRAIDYNSSNAEAYASRGLIILNMNDTKRGLKDIDKALEIKPHLKELWPLAASLKQQLGDYEGANRILDVALNSEPNNLGYLLSRAANSQKRNRFEEVIVYLNRALDIEPRMPEALLNLGVAFRSIGMLDDSIEAFSQAIEQSPDLFEGHFNLGNAYKQQDKLEKAIDCYLQAISISKELSVAYTMLCEIYEKLNRLEDLADILGLAEKQLKVFSADLYYFRALYLFRSKDFDACAGILKNLDVTEISETSTIDFYNLTGRCLDKIGSYTEAFATFDRMNELIASSHDYQKKDADRFFEGARSRSLQLRNSKPLKARGSAEGGNYSATFLVGFPRSGTTLLDTILRTHSSIEVLEEKPILSKVTRLLGDAQAIDLLERLEPKKVADLSYVYLEELAKFCDLGRGLTVIDKLPLNILEVPVVHQIFPEAKFILAIRHPFDCILSCYMQIFKLNPAMANMVQLDRIVDLYCASMEIMSSCTDRYQLNVHKIKYENLVANMEEEITKLLEFLGLKWQPELNQYQKTALERERVTTPSYSQVVQPLYKDSAYRWKNYEDQLSEYYSQIKPWIEKFDYVF